MHQLTFRAYLPGFAIFRVFDMIDFSGSTTAHPGDVGRRSGERGSVTADVGPRENEEHVATALEYACRRQQLAEAFVLMKLGEEQHDLAVSTKLVEGELWRGLRIILRPEADDLEAALVCSMRLQPSCLALRERDHRVRALIQPAERR